MFFASATCLAGSAGNNFAADPPAKKPATVAEAAKVIDFSKFPLLPGVEEADRRRVAGLGYQIESTVVNAFDFQKQQLLKDKWKELPNSFTSEQSASATFSREGFTVSLSVIATQPGKVRVSLTNHGNVDLQKLLVPKGAKPLYAFGSSAAFVTPESVEKTAEVLRMLLTDQGWQPYGTAGDSLIFKQNAVRLNAQVSNAPAQGGKTVIAFSTEQLSADLPAPPAETINLQYADITAQLMFDTSADKDEIAAFYRKALSPAGWEATTEKSFKIDFRDTTIFRNPTKDMLTLETYTVDDRLRVSAKYQSAAEIAELERQIQAAADRKKKEKEREKDKPKTRVAIKLPAGAKGVKSEKDSLEFTVAAGKAKEVADDLRKQLGKAGWKEMDAELGEMAGTVIFGKDSQTLTIVYVDSGFLPAEITISGPGVEVDK